MERTNLCTKVCHFIDTFIIPKRTSFHRFFSNQSHRHPHLLKSNKLCHVCPALCDPSDYSPPACSVHGIFQARILEWVPISFSRGSSLTQESNSCLLCLLHGRQILYTLSHWGSSFVFIEHLLKWLPATTLLSSSPSFVVRRWDSHSWLFIGCEASLVLDSSLASPTAEVPASVCSGRSSDLHGYKKAGDGSLVRLNLLISSL